MADEWNTEQDGKRSLKAPLIGAAIVVALGIGIWLLSQNISGVSNPGKAEPTVNLLPPPPPVPPPPPTTKEPPPQPDKMDVPKPEDQPRADNQPKQLAIDGPAQAGGDSFGIGAGKGGGSSLQGGAGGLGGGGGDFENANYRRLLKSEIQQAIRVNGRIERQFSTAVVAIWVDSSGRVRRSKINRSTGDDKVDADIIAALRAMPPLRDAPPAHFAFPEKVEIRGTRRG